MTKKERYRYFLEYFKKNMPEAETELLYNTPYELIVAVILSAQCTDLRVNKTTPELFAVYPTFKTLAAAEIDDVRELIKSISYPNNKARHLVQMAGTVMGDFEGKLPEDIHSLQKLQGVGRKTANVIASVLFNQPAMAVDTHVFRVSERIGLTWRAKNPLQAEKQLVDNIPDEFIHIAHHWLILHGRYTCVARSPKCEECGISFFCRKYEKDQKMKRL